MSKLKNQNVRSGEELPERELKQFLFEKELISFKDSILSIEQFTHGYSNLTYSLSIEGKEFVLRKPPKGAIKRGHDMNREYRVQKAIKDAFLKVPKMFVYTDDRAILGSEFYLMEKVEGIILSYPEAKKRSLSTTDFHKISKTWIQTFVELHALDYRACGLENLGKPEGYVERQVSNWSKQYVNAKTQEVPAANDIMKWLVANQPKSYQTCLIHNDFKYSLYQSLSKVSLSKLGLHHIFGFIPKIMGY